MKSAKPAFVCGADRSADGIGLRSYSLQYFLLKEESELDGILRLQNIIRIAGLARQEVATLLVRCWSLFSAM